MHYSYPATIQVEEDGRVTAYFDGLPGATWGETRLEALDHARDLLVTALEMLMESGAELPTPPHADGRPIVNVEIPA